MKTRKMKINSNLKKILSSHNGVALMMILSAITLLTLVVTNFSFETRLNSARISSQQKSLQAKLNAESGLKLALGKLKLYQEGHNLIEKDKKLKDLIPPSLLQEVTIMPFIYPVPLGPDANLIQKNALLDFEKESLIQGELNVEIIPVSGFLNPNNMRIKKNTQEQNSNETNSSSEGKFEIHSFIEKEITKAIEEAFLNKKESDETFESLYSDVDPILLVKELKYYVTDKGKFEDEQKGEVEQLYMKKGITPKFAPLTSLTELNLLEGWNDDFVNLLKDQFSVHEIAIIDINKLTQGQLKLIFPEITDEQSKEFFKYRDGDPNAVENDNKDDENDDSDGSPHPFNSEDDFKELLVTKLEVISLDKYSDRTTELTQAGLKFGVAGKLFKVISTGKLDNASYTIKAFVDLPIKPPPKKTPKPEDLPISPDDSTPQSPGPTPTPTPVPEEFLDPRVIEIYYND